MLKHWHDEFVTNTYAFVLFFQRKPNPIHDPKACSNNMACFDLQIPLNIGQFFRLITVIDNQGPRKKSCLLRNSCTNQLMFCNILYITLQ
jgi:hypothetical protein